MNFISGLAQSFAFAIFALALYFDYVKSKKGFIYKMLYIVSIFIHYIMIIPLVFRLLLNFNYKKYKYFFIAGLVVFAFFPGIIYSILSIFKDNVILAPLLNKAELYLFQSQSIFIGVYNIFKFGLLIFFTYIFFKNKKSVELNEKFLNMIEIVIFFCFAAMLYSDIFIRFNDLLLILMLIFIIALLSLNKKNYNVTIAIFVIFGIIMGSVNVNMIMTYNFGNLFNNFYQNIVTLFLV